MKVTVELDEKQLDGTFLKAFRGLTDERKDELVKDLLTKWFKGKLEAERSTWDSPARPLKDALNDLCQDMRKKIGEAAKNDKEVKKWVKAATKVVLDHAPELAMRASQRWFSQHMAEVMNRMDDIEQRQSEDQDFRDQMRMKLSELGSSMY